MLDHGSQSAWRRRIGVSATVVFGLAIAQAAHATPQTFYDVQIGGVTPPDVTATGSNLISAASSGTTATGTFAFSVFSGLGTLGDLNKATVSSATQVGQDVRSQTTFRLDNITVTGPAGSPLVAYNANFGVIGSINVSASAGSSSFGSIFINDLPGTTIGALAIGTNAAFDSNTGIFQSVTPTTNTTFNVSGTTTKQLVRNGGLATVFLNMSTDAIGSTSPNGGTAISQVDALDPLSLSTTGPVFNFFDPVTGTPVLGWTANSADGCIVDNLFTCGASGSSPTAVDEPPSLALLGAALLAWLIWARPGWSPRIRV